VAILISVRLLAKPAQMISMKFSTRPISLSRSKNSAKTLDAYFLALLFDYFKAIKISGK
jgi:hypothetical protein